MKQERPNQVKKRSADGNDASQAIQTLLRLIAERFIQRLFPRRTNQRTCKTQHRTSNEGF